MSIRVLIFCLCALNAMANPSTGKIVAMARYQKALGDGDPSVTAVARRVFTASLDRFRRCRDAAAFAGRQEWTP